MTTYTWPGFGVNRFEMSVRPNFRVFSGAFNSSAQALDLAGERWRVSLTIVPGRLAATSGPAIEAFIDRLAGPVHRVSLWNLARPTPRGTLQDDTGSAVWRTAGGAVATWSTSAPAAATWSYAGPALAAAAAAGSNTLVIKRGAGITALAGDHVGVGGQLFRVMADATGAANGTITVEVQPRVRTALLAGAVVTCTRPTTTFMLTSDGAPVTWRPGMHESVSADFIEAT